MKGFFSSLITLLLFVAVLATSTPQYQVSIGAIFRDEGRFLKEWIEYHRLIGVDHFYLYNNLSEDDFVTVLEPYIRAGIVELVDWPYHGNNQKEWNTIQCNAYTDLLKKAKRQTFWLAIIDTDEFILPRSGQPLPQFLKPYSSYGGLGINWQLFGTNDVAKVPENKTMIGTLTKRAPVLTERNKFIKSIVRPHRVKRIKQPHYCHYEKPFYHVDEHKLPLPKKSLSDRVSVEQICIHHYTCRDEAFFYGEKVRRLMEWTKDKTEVFKPAFNDEEDTAMQIFVPQLEKVLFSKSPSI